MNTISGLSWLEPDLVWLPAPEASAVFERTNRRMNPTMGVLALDQHQFHALEFSSAPDVASARAWLAERIGVAGRLFIIFGSKAVCTMSAASFLDHWQNMFGPGPDDVLMTNEQESWVLFYHHEDEFHFGQTKGV